MLAITRRELSSYFTAPIAYLFISAFYVIGGIFFFFSSILQSTTDMAGTFSSIFSYAIFLIPVLTMRMMSEELKHKTDQALLTAPISLFSLVMGKFLGAFIVYCLGLASTVLYAFAISMYAALDWSVVIGNIFGLLLVGASMIAMGMFISSLTENQIIAAIGSFVSMMLFLLMGSIAPAIPIPVLAVFMADFSLVSRYTPFTMGILDITSLVFFLSICAVFVFLTIRVFEKKRWS